jgi:hypothetical protein
MGEKRNTYRVWVWKPEGDKLLGWPRRTLEDINMRLQEICLKGVYRIDLAQDRSKWRALVNAVINLLVHKIRSIPLESLFLYCIGAEEGGGHLL